VRKMGDKKNKLKFIIFIAVAVISILLVLFVGIFNYNVENVKGLISSHIIISIIIYIGLIAVASATTLPITVTLIAGILVLSFKEALLYALIGVYLGAFLLYLFSIKTGKGILHYYAKGEKLKILDKLIHENAFSLVILLNFVYFFPSNLAHIVAGITNLKLRKFFIAMFGNLINTSSVAIIILGILNQNYIYVSAGIIILVLVTVIPLYIYRRHMRDLIILGFSRNAWKKLIKVKKEIKEEEKVLAGK
jgi:uncharacterized membrane protein YdjX (TVP38/TMEM64 family)